MERATAQLNNYRQSPRKVRVLLGIVRGKPVQTAIDSLMFAEKKSAAPIKKLIESALSSAKKGGMDTSTLVVKEISVNSGPILYRHLPMARGRAFPLRKRTSRVSVTLAAGEAKAKKVKKVKEVKAKEAVK